MPTPFDSNKELLSNVRSSLESSGIKEAFAGGIFGSLSRLELTPLSDIDLLSYFGSSSVSNKGSFKKSHISLKISRYPVDNIILNNIDPVTQFALLNGTNYHSLFFLTNIVGDHKKVEILGGLQKKLYEYQEIRVRECVNIISSYFNIAKITAPADRRSLKFGMEGTNKLVRLCQLAQLHYPDLVGMNTSGILGELSKKFGIEPIGAIKEWEYIFLNRVAWEKSDNNQRSYRSTDHPHLDNLMKVFLSEVVVWIQSVAGVDPKNLERFLYKVYGFHIEVPRTYHPSVMVDNFLKVVCSEDSVELEKLAAKSDGDWWTATNIASNVNASPATLESLVFPLHGVDPFLWRTVRLYAAKNPRTSVEILERILSTEGLREQDYEAAKNNLIKRNGK